MINNLSPLLAFSFLRLPTYLQFFYLPHHLIFSIYFLLLPSGEVPQSDLPTP